MTCEGHLKEGGGAQISICSKGRSQAKEQQMQRQEEGTLLGMGPGKA